MHDVHEIVRTGLSIAEFFKRFPDDAAAEQWLVSKRWPDGPVFVHCESDDVAWSDQESPTLATGARYASKEFGLVSGHNAPDGLWSNGTTIWVADTGYGKLYAYTLADGALYTYRAYSASGCAGDNEIASVTFTTS